MRKCLRPALLAVLVVLAVPAAAPAAGIGINVPGGANPALVPTAGQLGAALGRSFLVWDGSAAPSAQVVSDYTALVDTYAAQGMRPVITVTGLGGVPGSPEAYGSFIGALAAQLGNRVAAWEVWNEPDEEIWWGKAGGDPALYARFLKAAYPKASPHAKVILGGLTGNNYGFLEAVYRALGGSSAGAFDAVGVHTDTACSIVGPDSYYRNNPGDGRINRYTFLGLREVHRSMTEFGDANKTVWLTEVGWSTSKEVCDVGVWKGQKAGGVSEAQQADFLAQAWHCLKSYPFVEQALWFSLSDGAADTPETRYGLTRPDGSRKPAWQAFLDVRNGTDKFAGQGCGDFDAPTFTSVGPAEGAQFTGALPLTATATDASGVGRISVFVDGRAQEIRNFTPPRNAALPQKLDAALTANGGWQGAKALSVGEHTIRWVALDRQGNVATRTVKVVKVDPSRASSVPTRTAATLSGSGAKRRLRVTVTGPATINRLTGKVSVLFQKKAKGKWKTAHKYTKPAKAPFTLNVKLKKAQWRVRIVFGGSPGYRKSSSKPISFRV